MQLKQQWSAYADRLKQAGITRLYHFTDRDNLDSIVAQGGLYSWGDCEQKGINIAKPGGSDTSRSLDKRDNLQHYVRLSFCKQHPMQFVAMNDGRISNPVVLEIDLEVVYWEGCRYADRNAVKNGAHVGESLADFDRLHLATTQARNHFDLPEEEQQYYQAEVLVPHHVPLRYITNLADFGLKIPAQNAATTATTASLRTPYTAMVTRECPTAFLFLIDQSISMNRTTTLYGERMSMSEAVARIVNRSVEELINRCVKGDDIRHYFDIAAIGYGSEVRNAWQGQLADENFVTPNQLRQHPYRRIVTREEKRTRRGTEVKEVERVQWIDACHTDRSTRLHLALRKAQELLASWIKAHEGKVCYPPTIINITDGEYNGISDENIRQIANELKSLTTMDGNVLLFNIHIAPEGQEAVYFPTTTSPIDKDRSACNLYTLSSLLPDRYTQSIADSLGLSNTGERRRGLVVNAEVLSLIKILEIGTPTNISPL